MFLYYNDMYLMLITHILGLMSTDNQMLNVVYCSCNNYNFSFAKVLIISESVNLTCFFFMLKGAI